LELADKAIDGWDYRAIGTEEMRKMALTSLALDFTWLWVCMGVGAFLTIIATVVYALTAEPRPRHRRTGAPWPTGEHEQLPADSDREHSRV
jgi:hypothetical protein